MAPKRSGERGRLQVGRQVGQMMQVFVCLAIEPEDFHSLDSFIFVQKAGVICCNGRRQLEVWSFPVKHEVSRPGQCTYRAG